MHNDFRVAARIQPVPAFLQFSAQLGEIVNFAVKHNPHVALFVVDRLVPAGNVDDAEPAHAKCGASSHKKAFVIRTTMDDRITHPADRLGILRCAGTGIGNARNSTHKGYLDPERSAWLLASKLATVQPPSSPWVETLLSRPRNHYMGQTFHLALRSNHSSGKPNPILQCPCRRFPQRGRDYHQGVGSFPTRCS